MTFLGFRATLILYELITSAKSLLLNTVTFCGFQVDVNLGGRHAAQYNLSTDETGIAGWDQPEMLQRESGFLRGLLFAQADSSLGENTHRCFKRTAEK